MTLNASGISPDNYQAFGNIATGHYQGDASGDITVNLGFTPTYVKLIDMAASTGSSVWEWMLGMAAGDTLLTTGTVDSAIDANSVIQSNAALVSATEPGVYAQGTQEPNDGTIINTSVSVYSPDKTKAQLKFSSGTGGQLANQSTHTYVWLAIG